MLESLETQAKASTSSANLQINFNEPLEEIEVESMTVSTASAKNIKYDLIVGADGVNSVVRKSLEKQLEDFNVEFILLDGRFRVLHQVRSISSMNMTPASGISQQMTRDSSD